MIVTVHPLLREQDSRDDIVPISESRLPGTWRPVAEQPPEEEEPSQDFTPTDARLEVSSPSPGGSKMRFELRSRTSDESGPREHFLIGMADLYRVGDCLIVDVKLERASTSPRGMEGLQLIAPRVLFRCECTDDCLKLYALDDIRFRERASEWFDDHLVNGHVVTAPSALLQETLSENPTQLFKATPVLQFERLPSEATTD